MSLNYVKRVDLLLPTVRCSYAGCCVKILAAHHIQNFSVCPGRVCVFCLRCLHTCCHWQEHISVALG